jgi:hypothetical protein
MERIRTFRKEDISEVADLWQRAFRPVHTTVPDSLRSYFEEMFFRNPWQDDSLPSLVYVQDKAIVGFLGVLPRRMVFRGRPIKVAVATQFMVDPDRHAGPAAIDLMKRLFAGPQDLCFTDGAHQLSRQLWKRLGGDVALLQSLDWTRILQPTRYGLDVLRSMRLPGLIQHALRPVCRALDAVVSRRDLFRVRLPTGAAEEATPDTLLACLSRWSGGETLQPAYDDTLGWLLRQAGEKKRHGVLRSRLVRNAKGEHVGWFLYYLKSGGASTVVQVSARRHSAALVLNHLFHDARKCGALALSGQVQAELMDELVATRCIFRSQGLGVLVQSRNPELLASIHRGDARLSRLDGEWWLRFSDYRLGL